MQTSWGSPDEWVRRGCLSPSLPHRPDPTPVPGSLSPSCRLGRDRRRPAAAGGGRPAGPRGTPTATARPRRGSRGAGSATARRAAGPPRARRRAARRGPSAPPWRRRARGGTSTPRRRGRRSPRRTARPTRRPSRQASTECTQPSSWSSQYAARTSRVIQPSGRRRSPQASMTSSKAVSTRISNVPGGPSQRPRHLEPVQGQHPAAYGREPAHRVLRRTDRHREQSVRVGAEQRAGLQVGPHRHQVVLGVPELRVGEDPGGVGGLDGGHVGHGSQRADNFAPPAGIPPGTRSRRTPCEPPRSPPCSRRRLPRPCPSAPCHWARPSAACPRRSRPRCRGGDLRRPRRHHRGARDGLRHRAGRRHARGRRHRRHPRARHDRRGRRQRRDLRARRPRHPLRGDG